MYKILFSLLIVFGSLSAQNRYSTPDTKIANYKGKVRQAIENKYRATSGEGKGELVWETAYTYNSSGFITKTRYSRYGEPESEYQYEYENSGRLRVARTQYSFHRGSKINEGKEVYSYNKNANNPNKYALITTKIYNASGQFTDEFYEALSEREFPVQRVNSVSSNGFKGAKTKYGYDTKGNKTLEKYYGPGGKLITHREYEYNSKNQLTKFNNLKKGKVWNSWSQKFNPEGDVTTKVYYYSDGAVEKTQTFSYEYDARGNWTKTVEYENGKAIWVYTRMYEYY